MEDYFVKLVFWGVISWTAAFLFIRKIFSNRSFEFCNRIVSTIHATLAVTMASISVEDWSCPVCPMASKSSTLQMQTMAVSLAYLIYDLVCCLFDDKRVNLDNTIHHLVSIVGLVAGLAYQKCGSEMVGAIWITEISSPFLHWRELLKELGYRDTGLNLTADAMAFGLQIVSAFWFYKIARMTNSGREPSISEYLIYDLVCCLFDRRVSIDNTSHHLVSIVELVAGLANQKGHHMCQYFS
ncbi:hypothetical protein EZV62_021343 [Acer yangbiense]|uniref:TLC domain-containing protein n=1 Tax=Acer yangbiense TaxID=1000413 RepID=A0A5C7H5B0_9ROSI|nr:hypothetical protein EZV62_021343 [Acer yangbiense]